MEKLSNTLLVLVHYSCLGGQKIGKDAEGYFWGGTSDESKHHLVEWDEVSSPIENERLMFEIQLDVALV